MLKENGRLPAVRVVAPGGPQYRYESVAGTLELTSGQLEALARTLEHDARLRRSQPLVQIDLGRRTMHAGADVGFVQAGQILIEVYPKVLASDSGEDAAIEIRAGFGRLLRWCGELKVRPGLALERRFARSGLPEWMLYALARDLESAVGRGLRREYEQREEAIEVVRGRVLVGRQIQASAGLPLPMFCRFEEHTPDHGLARLLARLAEELASLSRSRSTRLLARRALRSLRPALPSQDVEVDLRGLTWTRANDRFRPLVETLVALLSGRTATGGGKGAPSWSVAFSLQGLFERYLERLLRELHRLNPGTIPRPLAQAEIGHLAPDQLKFQQQPDLVLQGATGTLIIDAKYKAPKGWSPAGDDVRQALTYALVSNRVLPGSPATDVCLIYPRIWGEPHPAVGPWTLEAGLPGGARGRIRLHVATVPFGRPPNQEQLASLASDPTGTMGLPVAGLGGSRRVD